MVRERGLAEAQLEPAMVVGVEGKQAVELAVAPHPLARVRGVEAAEGYKLRIQLALDYHNPDNPKSGYKF